MYGVPIFIRWLTAPSFSVREDTNRGLKLTQVTYEVLLGLTRQGKLRKSLKWLISNNHWMNMYGVPIFIRWLTASSFSVREDTNRGLKISFIYKSIF